MLIANWKEHPLSEKEAVKLARATDFKHVVICPPSIFIPAVSKVLSRAELGAQNGFWEATGPFTGEVSYSQLKKFGVKYVIIGHSERRGGLNEDNEMVARKVAGAVETGLIPVLCVGETLEERDRGTTKDSLGRQLDLDLALIRGSNAPFIITYEPIWAISTSGAGVGPDTPENAHEIMHDIRQRFHRAFPKLRVIYGGSVSRENVREFVQFPEVGGALVGSASLRPREFADMVEYTNQH